MSVVTRDKDMQKVMEEDDLRWTGGCKVRIMVILTFGGDDVFW